MSASVQIVFEKKMQNAAVNSSILQIRFLFGLPIHEFAAVLTTCGNEEVVLKGGQHMDEINKDC